MCTVTGTGAEMHHGVDVVLPLIVLHLGRWRSHREHVQASVRDQGQQQPAAGPRRRARSHRQPDRGHSGIRGAAVDGLRCETPQQITVLGGDRLDWSEHPGRHRAAPGALSGIRTDAVSLV